MLYRMGLEPPVRPIILAVEGLRSSGKWLETLDGVLREDFPEAIYISQRFKVSFRHVMIQALARPLIEQFRHYYTAAIETYGPPDPPVMLVAHSYGSFIAAKAVLRFAEIRVDKVVFVGSVVRERFRWDDADVNSVLNEVGGADRVVRMAGYIPGLGGAGLKGFCHQEKVTNLRNRAGEHSDPMGSLHMRRIWLPYLRYGRIVPPPQLQIIKPEC